MVKTLFRRKKIAYVVGFNAVFVTTSAFAAGTWYDARNDAMGGTGVASSTWSSAVLANPALMTKRSLKITSASFFLSRCADY